jgi:hypothetical protein
MSAGNSKQYFEQTRLNEVLSRLRKGTNRMGRLCAGSSWARCRWRSLEEVKELIREALDFYLEGMKLHGDPIPEPSAVTEYVSAST